MLLFIGTLQDIPEAARCFNTSHVTLYLAANTVANTFFNSFNTSHVTLYQYKSLEITVLRRFNTSHVTLYHNLLVPAATDVQRFNTSHVTLYPHS